MSKKDLIIIGAGAAGLACAIEAKKRNLDFLVIEKGCVVNSIYHFPVNMSFFTTADLLEIGDVPLVSTELKPRRLDALRYYRRVAEHYQLPINDYEKVLSVQGKDGEFAVETQDRHEVQHRYECQKVIVAIGYYDNPNFMNIPGEDLSKVSHYYSESHPYFKKKVAVIGGKNSAVETALELYREGASEVVLIHRGARLKRHIKYWILPDIMNRIKNGEIKAYFNTEVQEIRERDIVLKTPTGEKVIENDFVLAMTGYHPDEDFLLNMGIVLEPENHVPVHDPETLETNVKGLYIAGAIAAGRMTNLIFIENGRFHGPQIFKHWPASRCEVGV